MPLDKRTYRTRSAAVIALGAAVAVTLFATLPSALAPAQGAGSMSVPMKTGFIVIGASFALLMLRLAFCKVEVATSGVTVVNPFGTKRYRFDEIARFSLRRWGLLPRNGCLELVTGQSIGIWAISARNP